jgi:hypothetical protein
MTTATDKLPPSQSDKFKEAAREIGADDDEARWDDRLRKVVKHKPVPEKPE